MNEDKMQPPRLFTGLLRVRDVIDNYKNADRFPTVLNFATYNKRVAANL